MASEKQIDDQLFEALDLFRCSKDQDIEIFLRFKAIEYDERNWCRVYLLLNGDLLSKKKIKIEAYFTLSHKSVLLPKDISISKRKQVGGFSNSENIHFVLIGHLGKHIYIDKKHPEKTCISAISASCILDKAFDVIGDANDLISCRSVLVECNSNKKLKKLYSDCGFKFLQNDGEHNQLFKKILRTLN